LGVRGAPLMRLLEAAGKRGAPIEGASARNWRI